MGSGLQQAGAAAAGFAGEDEHRRRAGNREDALDRGQGLRGVLGVESVLLCGRRQERLVESWRHSFTSTWPAMLTQLRRAGGGAILLGVWLVSQRPAARR